MANRCANCGRIVHKNAVRVGELCFCDYVCLSLCEGHALEDELADLEDEWSAEGNDDN